MPTEHQSLKGQLLLDGGKLVGSFFHRTVVLICQHDAEGAFGLVLNRGSGHSVREVLVADLPEQVMELPLFVGGPVQPSAMSFLQSEEYLPEASVLPNLNLGHSLDELREIGDSYSPTSKLRLFAGYAGWSAGQLDGEMRRDSWLTHPADLDLVFHPKPEELWRLILRQKGPRYGLLAGSPEDPSVNQGRFRGLLCPRLINEPNDEDWAHTVCEDFRLDYSLHLDYLLERVRDVTRRNILAGDELDATYRENQPTCPSA